MEEEMRGRDGPRREGGGASGRSMWKFPPNKGNLSYAMMSALTVTLLGCASIVVCLMIMRTSRSETFKTKYNLL